MLKVHGEQNEKYSLVIYPSVTYGYKAQLITFLNTWVHIKLPLLLSKWPFQDICVDRHELSVLPRGPTQVECWKKILSSQMVIYQMLGHQVGCHLSLDLKEMNWVSKWINVSLDSHFWSPKSTFSLLSPLHAFVGILGNLQALYVSIS